jgi:hypothetical protein
VATPFAGFIQHFDNNLPGDIPMHHALCEPLLPVPPGATLLLIKPGERRRIHIIEKRG